MIDIGSINQFPAGKMQRLEIEGRRLLICRVGDEYYAVDNQCTHEDAPLHLGCIKGEVLHCSLHGGSFNIKTGQALSEPAELPLRTYPLTQQGERLYIELDAT